MSLLVDFKDMQDARARLHKAVRHTPVMPLARNATEIGAEKL